MQKLIDNKIIMLTDEESQNINIDDVIKDLKRETIYLTNENKIDIEFIKEKVKEENNSKKYFLESLIKLYFKKNDLNLYKKIIEDKKTMIEIFDFLIGKDTIMIELFSDNIETSKNKSYNLENLKMIVDIVLETNKEFIGKNLNYINYLKLYCYIFKNYDENYISSYFKNNELNILHIMAHFIYNGNITYISQCFYFDKYNIPSNSEIATKFAKLTNNIFEEYYNNNKLNELLKRLLHDHSVLNLFLTKSNYKKLIIFYKKTLDNLLNKDIAKQIRNLLHTSKEEWINNNYYKYPLIDKESQNWIILAMLNREFSARFLSYIKYKKKEKLMLSTSKLNNKQHEHLIKIIKENKKYNFFIKHPTANSNEEYDKMFEENYNIVDEIMRNLIKLIKEDKHLNEIFFNNHSINIDLIINETFKLLPLPAVLIDKKYKEHMYF